VHLVDGASRARARAQPLVDVADLRIERPRLRADAPPVGALGDVGCVRAIARVEGRADRRREDAVAPRPAEPLARFVVARAPARVGQPDRDVECDDRGPRLGREQRGRVGDDVESQLARAQVQRRAEPARAAAVDTRDPVAATLR